MSRSKSKINRQHIADNLDLIKQCEDLCRRITKKGYINNENLLLALSIRLRISPNECNIYKFDEKMLKNSIKELEYMLTID